MIGALQRLHLGVGANAWIISIALLVTLALLDICVVHRHLAVITLRRSVVESVAWTAVGGTFGAVVAVTWGGRAASQWFSGYLVELSLSADNVFVWAVILGYFAVPRTFQHRALVWAIIGAIVLRTGFILVGAELLDRFEWVLYLFGAFLLYTAFQLAAGKADDEVDIADSVALRAVRRVVPSTVDFDGAKLLTRVDGRRLATPLFAVVMLLAVTDVLFAVDSVPAVLAISRERFIVVTSNACAVLGLRSYYFMLADLRERFTHLERALAVILAFVGVKMLLSHWVEVSTPVSLAVIVVTLSASIAWSLRSR